MTDKMQYNSPSVATAVAGIASSADIAEGDDIIGVGHKATQEDKGQHSTRARKHRESRDHHPAAVHTPTSVLVWC